LITHRLLDKHITNQIYESSEEQRPRLILVTGTTGNVGSAVVRRLPSQGLEVAAMVRDAGAAGERMPPQVTLHVAD
jgi:nucleoside-diphosphate-sugar epimerase